MMRLLPLLIVLSQSLFSDRVPQRIDILTGVTANGNAVKAWIDVSPRPHMHVYALGAKGFDPINLTVAPQAGVMMGKPKYPPAELMASPGTLERVPVYSRPFRIEQPLTITGRHGKILVAGSLAYQACDDKLCYPTQSIAVSWTIDR